MGKKIVLLNGPLGSGKDFIADAFAAEYGGTKQMFKETLYEETAIYFEVHLGTFKVIANDRELKEQPLVKVASSFAKNLAEYLGKNQEDFFYEEEQDYFFSPREMLIYTSELVYKPRFGEDYFGVQAAKRMQEGLNLVSDAGFLSENLVQVDQFGADNVFLFRIHREGCEFSNNDSRSYIDLEDYGVTCVDLDNNRDISEVIKDIADVMLEGDV